MSMPCLGRIPFLLYIFKQLERVILSVNALSRANPISTRSKVSRMSTWSSVSMPCLGRIPFLPFETVTNLDTSVGVNALSRANPISTENLFIARAMSKEVCQCPVSGESHFYGSHRGRQGFHLRVSMPCLGRIPFLQRTITLQQWFAGMCQCPVSGESHFYEKGFFMDKRELEDVSMPCLGRIPFLRDRKSSAENYYKCVNALSRANPISTGTRTRVLFPPYNVSMPCLGRIPFLLLR